MQTDAEKHKRKPFHEEFAEKIIARLKEGTAPWQKPWEAGAGPDAPFNPASGTVYKGVNRLNLSMSSFDDPRWMTLKQANDQGLRIVAGSKGTPVVFYQFSKEEDRLDDDGKPVIGDDGKPEKIQLLLDRPIMRMAHVFNAAQIEGMPPLPPGKTHEWTPVERAERILSASGAVIRHDQSDRAYYSPLFDEIHLPPREQFKTAGDYYGTAVHELGHWTGAKKRLNREKSGLFGSADYAREELRAEIASWELAQDTGIPHDPDSHASYIDSWIKALEEDPLEIIRACRDAEKIKDYILGLEREHIVEQEVEKPLTEPEQATVETELRPATEKTFLAVPYAEKNQAKAFGAKWDAGQKSWYAPEGVDLSKLQAWLPDKQRVAPAPAMSPEQEFAQALSDAGLDLRGALPLMDGKIHRVPVTGRPNELDGAYCGYADGLPNGWAQNHVTGEKTKWIATGHVLSPEEKARMQAEMAIQRDKRAQVLADTHNLVAQEAIQAWEKSSPANEQHPYLQKKGIPPLDIKESVLGNLLVPVCNSDGELRGLQTISHDGQKRFLAGMEKSGNFHLLSIGEDPAKLAKGEILLAEGFATGASLHLATQKPVAVAFDAGNLEPVARALRAKFPEAKLVICADNDHTRQNNIGVEKAQAAALAVGGTVKIPTFTKEEMEKGLKDFNDLHQSRGLKEVAKQVKLSREKSKGKELER